MLDVVRAVAIVCVLLVHCAEKTYIQTGIAAEGGSLAFAAQHYMGRLGVPMFLFLTGALVVSKRFETRDDVVRFYKRSFLPLLMVTEVWCIIYVAFFYLYRGEFNSLHTVAYLLFLKQLPALLSHWWYMPMIVGVYAVLPLVALALQRAPRGALLVPASIVVLYVFAVPTFNAFAEALDIRQLPVPIALDLTFYGGIYGFYVALGYLLDRKAILRKVPAAGLVALALVAAPIGIWGAYRGVDTWYDSVFILVDAVVFFELLLRMEAQPSAGEARDAVRSAVGRFVTWLSAMSFAVYLVHMPILILIPLSAFGSMPLLSMSLLQVLIVLGLSMVVVSAVRRVPVVGKRLFLQK